MLPPPPKRTRAVVPPPETGNETSNALPPPPSSRDRRNRRLATNTANGPAIAANPLFPTPGLFTPLSTFTPFVPPTTEDLVPETEPENPTTHDPTPQTSLHEISPLTVEAATPSHTNAFETIDSPTVNEDTAQTTTDTAIENETIANHWAEDFSTEPANDTTESELPPSEDTLGGDELDGFPLDHNPHESTDTGATSFESGWGADPEDFGYMPPPSSDVIPLQDSYELHSAVPSTDPEPLEGSDFESQHFDSSPVPTESSGGLAPEYGHNDPTAAEDAKIEALIDDRNVEDEHFEETHSLADSEAQPELNPVNTNALAFEPTTEAFADWGEDMEGETDGSPEFQNPTTNPVEAPLSTDPHEIDSQKLHDTQDNGEADWGEDFVEPESVVITASQPANEPLLFDSTSDHGEKTFDGPNEFDWGEDPESNSFDTPSTIEEPAQCDSNTQELQQQELVSQTAQDQEESTETESLELGPPQASTVVVITEPSDAPLFEDEALSFEDDGQEAADPPSHPNTLDAPETHASTSEFLDLSPPSSVELSSQHQVIETPAEFDSGWDDSFEPSSPVEPEHSVPLENVHTSAAPETEESPTEEDQDGFCEIDATSRRVLESLHPVDTSMHPIAEWDEVSSTASAETPRSLRLGNSISALPRIEEDSSGTESEQTGVVVHPENGEILVEAGLTELGDENTTVPRDIVHASSVDPEELILSDSPRQEGQASHTSQEEDLFSTTAPITSDEPSSALSIASKPSHDSLHIDPELTFSEEENSTTVQFDFRPKISDTPLFDSLPDSSDLSTSDQLLGLEAPADGSKTELESPNNTGLLFDELAGPEPTETSLDPQPPSTESSSVAPEGTEPEELNGAEPAAFCGADQHDGTAPSPEDLAASSLEQDRIDLPPASDKLDGLADTMTQEEEPSPVLESATEGELEDIHVAEVPLTEVVAEDEEDIVFAELDATEAESLFNQFKDSLKEHQDTLKQLLEEREAMRIELQTVMLEYAPISELQERLASIQLEYDELSRQSDAHNEPDETLAVELSDLAETIYHYETAIQRRLEDTERSAQSEVEKSGSSTLHTSSGFSSHAVDDSPASLLPEIDNSHVMEIEALKQQLYSRDAEIEEFTLQVSHLKVHVSTLEDQLKNLKEAESENEIVQEELRREVEEAQKLVDKMTQQDAQQQSQHAETIAHLEAELERVREEAQRLQNERCSLSKSSSSLHYQQHASESDIEVESFTFDGTEPIEVVNAKISELLFFKAQANVDVHQLKLEVQQLVEKLSSTERRFNIEVSALDSQLVERETENMILREKLSSATVTELSPELQMEMEKLQKGYETCKIHLSKCEQELEEAVSRANELDQLWKAECQLRSELQHHQKHQKQHSRGQSAQATNGTFHEHLISKQLTDAESKISELELVLQEREAHIASLEAEIGRLKRTMEGLEAKGKESAKSVAKQSELIEQLRQQLNSMELEAASKPFDHEAALNESLATKNLRIEELELELKGVMENNDQLVSEVNSLKTTLAKLDKRYQQMRHNVAESDSKATEALIEQLRLENRQLQDQLTTATQSKISAESLIDEKKEHLAELESELASVQQALEAVQADMISHPSKREPSEVSVAPVRSEEDNAYIDDLTMELQLLRAQLNENMKNFETSQEHINDLEQTVSTCQKEKSDAVAQLKVAQAQATQEKHRAHEFDSELQEKLQLVQELEAETEATTRAHQASMARITELEALLGEQQDIQAKLQKEISSQSTQLTALQAENSEYASYYEQSNIDMSVLKQALEAAREELDRTRLALSQAEAEYSGLSSELEHTRTQLREAQEALENPKQMQSKEEDLATIESLKAELSRKDGLMYEAYAAFEGEMAYMAQELESQWKEKVELAKTSSAALHSPASDPRTSEQYKRIEQELEAAKEALELARTEIVEKNDLQAKMASDLVSVQREKEELIHSLNEIQKAASDAEQKQLEAADALALQVASLEDALSSTRSELAECQAELESQAKSKPSDASDTEIASLKAQITALTDVVQQSEATVEQYLVQLDELKQEAEINAEKLKTIKSTEEAFNDLVGLHQSLQRQHSVLEDAQQTTEAELERALAQVSLLSSTASEWDTRLKETELDLKKVHIAEISESKQREEALSTENKLLKLEATELSAEVSQLSQEVARLTDAKSKNDLEVLGLQESLEESRLAKAEVEAELVQLTANLHQLTHDYTQSSASLHSLRSENEHLLTELDAFKQAHSSISASTSTDAAQSDENKELSQSIASKSITVASMDDWGADEWETSSPVEPQAELEYLRTFLKTKTKEVDELKMQLSLATQPPKVLPALAKVASGSSVPSSPYVAPLRVSSPSMAPVVLPTSDTNDIFGEDGGWDDLEFESLPATSTTVPIAKAPENDPSQYLEEIGKLKAHIEELKGTEKQIENLKKALASREGDLEESTEQYHELQATYEATNSRCDELEAQLKTKEEELEKSRSLLHQAQIAEAVPTPTRTYSSPEIAVLQGELDRAKQTIKTLQTMLTNQPASTQVSGGSIAFDSDEDENGWGSFGEEGDKKQASQLNALEREIETLRHLSDQKDADLSSLRLEVASLKSEKLTSAKSEATSSEGLKGQPSDFAETPEDVASRLSQAVEHERSLWQSEIQKLEDSYEKQIQDLELKHLTELETLEISAQETLQAQIDRAVLAAKSESESSVQRRLHDAEEVHQAQKELLQTQFAKLSADHQAQALKLSQMQTQLTSVLEQNKSLSDLVAELKVQISERSTQTVSDASQLDALREENEQLRAQCDNLRHTQLGDSRDMAAELESLRAAREAMDASHLALKETYQMQLEEAHAARLEAEAKLAISHEKLEEAKTTVQELLLESQNKREMLHSKEVKIVELQSRMNSEKHSRESSLMSAEEDAMTLRDENTRLKQQLEQSKKSIQSLNLARVEQEAAMEALRQQDARSAAQLKTYLTRLEQLQAIVDKPVTSASTWAEEQLLTQSVIAERLTTENAKLSKGLVSGLMDQQTPVERLAAAKALLQERVDRLEKENKRVRNELVARTEERDSLTAKVHSLTSERQDLKRQISASPAARFHSPAAHFASYATATPSSPYHQPPSVPHSDPGLAAPSFTTTL
jgi:chromosome segregation ATPase